jgi:hypothetical protein
MAADDRLTDGPRRYAGRIFWVCAVLTAAVGGFLVVDVTAAAGVYRAGAWLGVALSALAILTLILVYAGCALGRFRLNQRLVGNATVFHLTVAALVLAIGADTLIPNRDADGLALLLPWGISYWFHNQTDGPRRPAD